MLGIIQPHLWRPCIRQCARRVRFQSFDDGEVSSVLFTEAQGLGVVGEENVPPPIEPARGAVLQDIDVAVDIDLGAEGQGAGPGHCNTLDGAQARGREARR